MSVFGWLESPKRTIKFIETSVSDNTWWTRHYIEKEVRHEHQEGLGACEALSSLRKKEWKHPLITADQRLNEAKGRWKHAEQLLEAKQQALSNKVGNAIGESKLAEQKVSELRTRSEKAAEVILSQGRNPPNPPFPLHDKWLKGPQTSDFTEAAKKLAEEILKKTAPLEQVETAMEKEAEPAAEAAPKKPKQEHYERMSEGFTVWPRALDLPTLDILFAKKTLEWHDHASQLSEYVSIVKSSETLGVCSKCRWKCGCGFSSYKAALRYVLRIGKAAHWYYRASGRARKEGKC